MSARDRWTINVKCPLCGNTGEVRVSQADGWAFERDSSTSVDFVPTGFYEKAVGQGKIPDFYCSKDNVKAG